MSVKLIKKTLENSYFCVNSMVFLPSKNSSEPMQKDSWALFTHGYTASKRDCLPWAQRLAEAGIPSVIFDLPGHYLGSFNECESFDDFVNHAHEIFTEAFEYLKASLSAEGYDSKCSRVILGGHSLGALLAVKALELEAFQNIERIGIGVGLGIGQHKTAHLFETSFYEKTLNIRRQLVSPAIDSDRIFSWIKQQKLDANVKGQRIHLITGQDDVVVGAGGMEAQEFSLKELGNIVTTHNPRKLPHHEPIMAATHIHSFLKKELSF